MSEDDRRGMFFECGYDESCWTGHGGYSGKERSERRLIVRTVE